MSPAPLGSIRIRLQEIAGRIAIPLLRISVGLVFIWFGWPKLVPGLSPADALAVATTERITFGVIGEGAARICVALLELFIGMMLVTGRAPFFTAALVGAHMAGACAPLVLFPGETWKTFAVGTLEGQYILKNVIVLAAVFVTLAARSRRTSRG